MSPKLKIIIAMTVFGTLALFVKNIPLPSEEIALFRALIASGVILAYKLLFSDRLSLSSIKQDLPVLFLSGAAMAFNWIFLFMAYDHTSVSLATLSYYFAPVIVMAASPLLFKETLTPKQIFCFVMSTAGLVMIIGVNSSGDGHSHFTGIGFGLAAAALYATVILLNKHIKSVTGIDRTLIQFFAAIIILVPYIGITRGIQITGLDFWGLSNLLVLGVIHTGITYCLYFSAIKDLTGQEAAIFSYIDPMVAVLISIAVLDEAITPLQIAGGLMILGFTLLNELNIRPDSAKAPRPRD